MTTATLAPTTTIGTVGLSVADLDRSLAFYTDVIGLRLLTRHNGQAELGVADGAAGIPLLSLTEKPGARIARRTSGLYHFAILVPTRPDLARALRQIAETETPVQGFADHAVSEAIYLPDPDGHGIEIYSDRPRSTWRWQGKQVHMVTDPLDIDDLISEIEGEPSAGDAYALAAGTRMGHIHLHVADLDAAQGFYRDALGFDVMAYMPSAVFLAAGGYHHHIGMNTWAGVGAPPAPADALRLEWYAIDLPDEAARDALLTQVEAAGLPVSDHPAGVQLNDPAGNTVVLRAKA